MYYENSTKKVIALHNWCFCVSYDFLRKPERSLSYDTQKHQLKAFVGIDRFSFVKAKIVLSSKTVIFILIMVLAKNLVFL